MSRLPLPLGDSSPLGPPTGRDYNFGILSLGEEVPSALGQRLRSFSHGDAVVRSRCNSGSCITAIAVHSPSSSPICSSKSSSSSPTILHRPSGLANASDAVVEARRDPGCSPIVVHNGLRDCRGSEITRISSIPARVVSGLTVYEASPTSGALKNLAAVRPVSQEVQNQVVRNGSEVILHVYDLDRMTKRLPGMMAFYHMGVEVFKQEIFFSVQGILACTPGGHQTHIHKKTVNLGRTMLDAYQVKAILEEMGEEWKGSCYSLTGRNCQTFAVAFAEKLGLGSTCIPRELHWKWDVHASRSAAGGVARGLLGRMLSSKSGSGSKAAS